MTIFIVSAVLAVIVLGNLRLFALVAGAVVLALAVAGAFEVGAAVIDNEAGTTVVVPSNPGSMHDSLTAADTLEQSREH